MKKLSSLILLLFTFLSSCQEEEFLPLGTQLILNQNLSQFSDSVNPWKPSNPDGIQLGVSREVLISGNRSLFIESPVREKAEADS